MKPRILFASSEMYPLIKTGGLADVSSSLPLALENLGHDTVVVIPGYQQILDNYKDLKLIGEVSGFMIPDGTQILEVPNKQGEPAIWLVHCDECFGRSGGPYTDGYLQEWPDNAYRFAVFSRVVYEIAMGKGPTRWMPDIVHCNDWQTGLIPALLSLHDNAPPTVLTIHNLAYQGNFSKETFDALLLPDTWWDYNKVEFYGKFSFLKAGIVFSDYVTTVSPTYANEILTHDYGFGMDGLLTHYKNKLKGILNGVDYSIWNPANDPLIKFNYSVDTLENKEKNKLDLQYRFGLSLNKDIPMVGIVSRLVHQKGIDYEIECIKHLIDKNVQWVIQGNGEEHYESQLSQLAAENPKKLAFINRYDEGLAHQIEASSDMFLMGSRFEPCGLNQIYSLKYGTLPIVRYTGGLADTVVNVSSKTVKKGNATGFVFKDPNPEALMAVLKAAIKYYKNKSAWKKLQESAMCADFSWAKSAAAYSSLYHECLQRKVSTALC